MDGDKANMWPTQVVPDLFRPVTSMGFLNVIFYFLFLVSKS